MRIDRGMILSIAGHSAFLLWALVSFARPLETAPLDMFPVDVLTTEEFSRITAGTEKAQKTETPKPVVEKIAEPKPAEDLNAKVTEKKEVQATTSESTPEPAPKQAEPKPAAAPPEPKQEAKAPEKKEPEQQKIDPIAEALKKDDTKKPDKKVENKPQPVKKPEPQQPKFDPRKVAALLDKRDPQRLAAAGSAINTTASLGAPKGAEASLSANEIDQIRRRLTSNWNKPVGATNSGIVIDIDLDLLPDGRLAAEPVVTTRERGPLYDAVRESAIRAIRASAPFDMLSRARYEHWRRLALTFKVDDLI
jgi:outer membrane biosynthesis protein TonB